MSTTLTLDPLVPEQASSVSSIRGLRIESIDMVRGMVMILMALDHVRDYFHFDAYLFDPTDLSQTSPALFATRWITHLCAPTFILLAGTSAYLINIKKGKSEASKFLYTRGLWLVFLEVTVVAFAWSFDPYLQYNGFSIISTIGFSMIFLAGLIYLPFQAILLISLIVVLGHNALDGISFSNPVGNFIWSFLHVFNSFQLENGYIWEIAYPLFPWVSVMALGYCLGSIYTKNFPEVMRKKILIMLAMASFLLFLMIRAMNIYGDPMPWNFQNNYLYTLMSFINFEKYPPSLLFLCSTLSISLFLLYLFDGRNLKRFNSIILIGKVPLFYYVLHLYLIHFLAMIAAVLTGHPWNSMIFYSWIGDNATILQGSFGFNLGIVYIIWMAIVLILYPFCLWFNGIKMKNKGKWWVSYV